MKKRRWLIYTLAAIGIILVAAIGFAWRWTRVGLAPTSGKLVVAGLSKPVTIYRDKYGVPHIYASSIDDAAFAQGYAEAQDRLWEMDLSRRGVEGKLAEILGDKFVDQDYFVRTIGFTRAAEKSLAVIKPETMDLLQSFASGVNAYLQKAGKNLPPEFRLLKYSPEPWTPVDSLVIGKYMSWILGGNWEGEIFRASLLQKVDPQKAMEIFPSYEEDWPVIARDWLRADEPAIDRLLTMNPEATINGLLGQVAEPVDRSGLGSNNWVVSGAKTKSGKPLLANDPHLGIQLPSIWWQVQLNVPGEENVIGVVFPGVPGVIVGHNDRIAWGVTNVGPDVQDLYIEKQNPSDPYSFEFKGKWEKATVYKEEIKVKGKTDPVVREVVETRHGPIISKVVSGLKEPIAMRWTALDASDEFEAFYLIDQAKNWSDFKAGLSYFDAPAQNFVYADVDGNIGYRANGKVPIRAKGDGLVPVPGWTGEYEWTGYIPFDKLPELYNPAEGFIATANNRVVGSDYPYFISAEWAAPYRAMRIVQYLGPKTGLTVADMQALQTDKTDLQAGLWVPHITKALEGAKLTPEETKARDLLAAWGKDPVDTVDQVGPSVFQQFYRDFLHETFADELGDDLFAKAPGLTIAVDTWLTQPGAGADWFDDVKTPQRETFDDIVRRAFSISVGKLDKALGPEPAKWTWGRLHQITFAHAMGAVKPLDKLFNVGPFPMGGSAGTVMAASYSTKKVPYLVTSAAPWRQVVDLSDLRHSYDVTTPGESGERFSKHYADQAPLWLKGEYHLQAFDQADLEGAQEFVLEPGK
ncbi:MAG: penicillin acylase family protein [Bacillota bacterium]